VSPVPGPSAVVAALSVSGLPTDRYCFEGFLPAKKAARRDRLAALQSESRSIVFYVAVHRIAAALEDLAAAFGAARDAFLGRELTKMHEQCVATTLGELLAKVRAGEIAAKGEFVVIVAGNPDRESTDAARASAVTADRLLAALIEVMPGRQAATIVAEVCDLARDEVYRRMLRMTDDCPDEGD
jgi:16S rRNA (cytidine1402-2'-O)-methyltransferase